MRQAMRAHMISQKIGETFVKFYDGLAPHEIEDVQLGLLYAEILANAGAPDKNLSWMEIYKNALTTVCCSLVSEVDYKPKIVHLHTLNEPLTFTINNQPEGEWESLAKAVVHSLNTLEIQRYVTNLFVALSPVSKTKVFQCAPCGKTPNGEIEVVLCGVIVTSGLKPDTQDQFVRVEVKGGTFIFDKNKLSAEKDHVQRTVHTYSASMISLMD